MACGEAIPPDIIPGSFIHVPAKFDAVRAGHDETFFGTHLLIAADVEIEAFFKLGEPEFQDIHDREADFVITDEGGPDPLREVPKCFGRGRRKPAAPFAFT